MIDDVHGRFAAGGLVHGTEATAVADGFAVCQTECVLRMVEWDLFAHRCDGKSSLLTAAAATRLTPAEPVRLSPKLPKM